MRKLAILLTITILLLPLVSAYSFIDSKGNTITSGIISGAKDVPVNAVAVTDSWVKTNVQVTPARAQSWSGNDFMQTMEVCNRDPASYYYYFVPEFGDLKSFEILKEEKTYTPRSSLMPICYLSNISVSFYNITKGSNQTGIQERTLCDRTYQYNYTEVTSKWNPFKPGEYSTILDKTAKVMVTSGFFLKQDECQTLKLHYITYSSTGKWDFNIYGNDKDDYSCIATNSCSFTYKLDPWYDTTSLNLMRKRYLTIDYKPGWSNRTIPIWVNAGLYNNQTSRYDYVFTNTSTSILLPYEIDWWNNSAGINRTMAWVLQDWANTTGATGTYDIMNDSTLTTDFSNNTALWNDYSFVYHATNQSESRLNLNGSYEGTILNWSKDYQNTNSQWFGQGKKTDDISSCINFNQANIISSIQTATTQGTFIMWESHVSNPDYIAGTSIGSSLQYGFAIVVDGTDLKCSVYSGGAYHYAILGDKNTYANSEYMWACVWNSSGVYSFRNGALIESNNYGATTITYNNLPLSIGCSPSGTKYYTGISVDEVRVANYSMNATDLARLYTMGDGTATTSNSFNSSVPFVGGGGGGVLANFTIAVYSNKTGLAILSPWNVTINGTIQYNLTGSGLMPTNFSGGWASINISSRYFGNYYNASVSLNGTFNISLMDKWVIKAIDYFNRTNLSVWNVTIDLFTPGQVTYNVTAGQGEAITNFLMNDTSLHWTIVEANGYSGPGLSFWNQTANASHNLEEALWQAEVSMGAMEKASYNIISGGTFKSAYMNSTGILKLPAGPVTITFNKTGYYNQSADFVFANQNYTGLGDQYISEIYNRILNITAYAINTSNLSVFNATIVSNNYPWSDFNSTITGVSQFFLINGSYNITLASNGFWEEEITNRSTDPMGAINRAMYRFRVNVIAINGVNSTPVQVYNVTTMWNNSAIKFNTTNGSLSVTQLDVPFYLNFTTIGYSNFTYNMTGTPHGEVNLTINVSPLISFRVLLESDGVTPFNVNATNFTKVWIYCPGKTLVYQFFPSYTITHPIDCPWVLMKLDVQYPTQSYFKTYIPALNSTNITFYAIDLGSETAVEIIFILNDMTGQFQNSTLIITEPLGTGEIVVLAQQWDIENKVVAYLIKDRLYTIKIRAVSGELRVIGNFIPESAGTKTITIPNIDFLPPTHLGSSVLWAWSVNATPIRLQYNDTLSQTNWIDFRVLNASNTSHILTSSSAGTSGIVTFSYNAPTNLTDYIACFNASHSVLGSIGECHVYSNVISPLGSWDGWTPSEANKIRNWIAIVCIMLVLLGAGYFHVAVGLGLGTFLLWFFLKIGWFFLVSTYVTYAVLGIMATITAISFFLEVTRK